MFSIHSVFHRLQNRLKNSSYFSTSHNVLKVLSKALWSLNDDKNIKCVRLISYLHFRCCWFCWRAHFWDEFALSSIRTDSHIILSDRYNKESRICSSLYYYIINIMIMIKLLHIMFCFEKKERNRVIKLLTDEKEK
jgi:hypothetical protein